MSDRKFPSDADPLATVRDAPRAASPSGRRTVKASEVVERPSRARQAAAKPSAKQGGPANRLRTEPEGMSAGGEIHQVASENGQKLTTNMGTVISDDENSLRAGQRGPALLEDFAFREKMFHFDHERIPERVVHARGTAAHGYFELATSLSDVTTAAVLTETGVKTPVFVRFSTVAGNRGSADLARDVRGFAVKFYTSKGNWDLVGNNIPVFFIQDAIKFPDLIHSVKEEPDRGFPQAASAHDTFYDFISLTPESMHMLMWVMSDRAIPRSLRMMEGFGIHSFRLIDKAGNATFVKFHWRPKLGISSAIWDEAVKLNGADPDFHRRDLYNAIAGGDFPEWELGVQLFDDAFAAKLDFDHLDATKLIPEEILPLKIIGRMVLDRNPDNVFDETEQVAFGTQNVVPGIDFSDDPLLQGRNFSYLDTQLKRLGSTNFFQLPINAPKCPFANFQREGQMQSRVHKGRVAYQPSMLDPEGPREDPRTGFTSFAAPMEGNKLRARSPSFADHYTQARMFFLSQTDPERNHIVAALTFELSKVETGSVRAAMLGHLAVIHPDLGKRVAAGLGADGSIALAKPAQPPRDMPASPALSILAKAKPTFKGRMVGILVTDGADGTVIDAVVVAAKNAGAVAKIVAPKVGGVTLSDGKTTAADFQLAGGPSVLFDAVAVVASTGGVEGLMRDSAAVAWLHDAFAHLKVIAATREADPLLDKAGVKADGGVLPLKAGEAARQFIVMASKGRVWARESAVRMVI